jgi:multifunctional methyltransferase subunit TRM112
MRLLVHNLIQCHKQNCQNKSFPLHLNAKTIEKKEAEFRPDFIVGLLQKIDLEALRLAANEVIVSFLIS